MTSQLDVMLSDGVEGHRSLWMFAISACFCSFSSYCTMRVGLYYNMCVIVDVLLAEDGLS